MAEAPISLVTPETETPPSVTSSDEPPVLPEQPSGPSRLEDSKTPELALDSTELQTPRTDTKELPTTPRDALPALPRHDSEQSSEGGFEDVQLDAEKAAAAAAASVVASSSSSAPVSADEATVASSPDLSVGSRTRSSTVTTLSAGGDGRPKLLAGVLIVSSLETLANSKDAKRNPALRDATKAALDALKGAPGSQVAEPRLIFEPLRLACETKSYPLVILALDCVGKLVSHVGAEAGAGAGDGISEAGSRRSSAEISTSNFAAAASADPKLAEDIVNAVCGCFVETANTSTLSNAASAATAAGTWSTGPEAVNLHILSVLISLILASTMPVHQTALLTAVRTVYNIFLLSRSHQTQMVAQGALGQIVGAVFSRVQLSPANARGGLDSARNSTTDFRSAPRIIPEDLPIPLPKVNGTNGIHVEDHDRHDAGRESSETVREATEPETSVSEPPEEGGLQLEHETDKDATPKADATPRPSIGRPTPSPGPSDLSSTHLPEMNGNRTSMDAGSEHGVPLNTNDLHIKDAFLVFRALCKLSTKPLGSESERDLRSHAMRSKLLALHLILTILHNHLQLFLDPNVVIVSSSSKERTPFVQAVRNYLFFTVNRNAVSSVIQVFEISCEIFWRMLSGLRAKLKSEIALLMNEIFLPLLEMRHSSVKQKSVLLGVFSRLCYDPQALVEVYLNYDCDRTSLDNVYERLINVISRIGTTQFTTITPPGMSSVEAAAAKDTTGGGSLAAMPPVPQAPNMPPVDAAFAQMPYEVRLKKQSLECLAFVVRSLVEWSGKSVPLPATEMASSQSSSSLNASTGPGRRQSEDNLEPPAASSGSGAVTPELQLPADDPGRFENAKQRKTTLLEGIKKFNFKPKRGINFLIETGFIRSRMATDVAKFLLHADGLSKANIGEYLGEGDPENIEIMHSFVDMMDFAEMKFVDALRMFLQSFRLPGEAQKIDRFMLKFAERYVAGNPSAFANADTAYVLSYSVIMLNTDLYNPQNKRRMTKGEFVKNNRGINDGQDLQEQYLNEIYDEIATNEIRMKDEIDLTVPQGSGLSGAIVGRDAQREQYMLQSENMATKTEALFRSMLRQQRRAPRGGEVFFSASHFEHVRPMFMVVWMPLLAGISAPLQDSEDMDMIYLSLEGFKQASKIVCLFDLELERNAFITTLAKFTFLNNLSEMKPKNVEAIKTLFDIAMINGNYLKGSWREVLACVSHLERFQLIAQGVDSRNVPDVGRKPQATRQGSGNKSFRMSRPTDEVARETASSHITMAADRIFSSSSTLSGNAIVDFVQALSDVSWEEIQASGLAEQPRTFCLQKLVEISYYNMGRIRLEWSNIWAILGEHFNQVCCHSNSKISFFALDSLRQLASRFLEKEELAHFKFQKDFLKPFEYAMVHNSNNDIRDMILQCLRQMIQARVDNLRSGWRTMFSVFSAASKILTERVVSQAFEVTKSLNQEHFSSIVAHGAFADLTVCITDFCKISKYQKISLHAVEMLRGLVTQMLSCPECPLNHPATSTADGQPVNEDPIKWWFPILFGFYDVIMNGEDLEVRKRALDYLFETLKVHGTAFPFDFWQHVCKEVLFPIFTVLSSPSDVSRLSAHEDMSVWLSTTMIQALRNLVDLYSFYFDVLGRMLERLLRLLQNCICQENDTLARIGTACLQQLLQKNVRKLSPEHWEQIISTFITLFKRTTAHQLFDEKMRIPEPPQPSLNGDTGQPKSSFVPPLPLSPGLADAEGGEESKAFSSTIPPPPRLDRKQIFRQIIVKCVLQLLLIETAHELLQNEEVYMTIPPADLLRLMAVLDDSYRFAKKFNADKDLRTGLWKVGFMKQLPNLLKQESSSAAVLVSVLLRMYGDHRPDHVAKRAETVGAFVPLGIDVLSGFVTLELETQARNIAAWTPVVAEVLQGFASFADETLSDHVLLLYPLAIDLLAREMPTEVRESLRSLLFRVGVVKGLLQGDDEILDESIAEEVGEDEDEVQQ